MREEIVWRALISPAFGRLYLATSPGIIQKSSLEMSLEVQEGKKKKNTTRVKALCTVLQRSPQALLHLCVF
jgi:hypothetical protein